MALGCGAFGPSLSSERTEKVKKWWKFKDPKYISFLYDIWIIENDIPLKFYGAEYIDICSQCYENESMKDSDICIECYESNWGEDN